MTIIIECIAQFTQRPLISLTTSDIGTDPAGAETKLNFHFARAKLWDAILLIDEADIYMERREAQGFDKRTALYQVHHCFLHASSNLTDSVRLSPCNGKLPKHSFPYNKPGWHF